MNQKIKTTNLLIGLVAFAFLITVGSVEHVYATSPWHENGQKAPNANTNELNVDVQVVTPPGSGARQPNASTLIWMGGYTSNGYLVQPELRAWTSSYWTGYMEILRPTGTTIDIYGTNINAYNGDSIELDVKTQSASMTCMYIKKGLTTASKCFTSATYGSTFGGAMAYNELESYSSTASDFTPMGSPIQFTDFRGYYTTGGSYTINPSPNHGSGPQLSCIDETTGTGSTTITNTC